MLESPQILLKLEPQRPDQLEDFVPGPNANALDAVRQLLDRPDGLVFLCGPAGSGKSHLLNALFHAARRRALAAFYVPLRRLPEEAAAGLEGLQGLDLVCVDDLDHVVGDPVWEQALFRCFNEVRASRGRILVASRHPLSALSFVLPDLASRLGWGIRQKLALPADEDKRAILRRHARRWRIEVPADVERYLLRRGRRDLPSLLASLERIRDAAFAGKRRITVPLAREVLSEQRD